MGAFRRYSVAVAFLYALAQLHAQQVTLSGRVKLVSTEKQADAAQPERVVVWLTPLDSKAPVKPFHSGPLKLTQHHKSFEPHILVVPVGAMVQFPNHDPFFHNVFSLFEGKRFDLGLYEAGSSRDVLFDRPGVSYIFCNIHAEMSAVVIALDTPYYSISSAKGEVVIPEVPIGRYTMHLWYETSLPDDLKAMTREINVTAQSSTLGVIEIATQRSVTAHTNKYGMDYEPPAPNSPGYTHP
jgi:plastocyanin